MCEERCIHPVKDIGLYTVLGRNEATINMLFSCSVTSDSCDPWTVDRQAPLSTGFSRQEYWSGLPCPSPDYKHMCTEILNICFFPPGIMPRCAITGLCGSCRFRFLVFTFRNCQPVLQSGCTLYTLLAMRVWSSFSASLPTAPAVAGLAPFLQPEGKGCWGLQASGRKDRLQEGWVLRTSS